MERQANYPLVGVITILLVIGGLVFAVWLGNVQVGRDTDRYRIIFKGPLSGVSVGGEVQFNGIKVGEVKDVRLAEQDTSKIIVDVEVGETTPVRIDSLASTAMQGISGVNAILIGAGTPTAALLRDVSRDDPPVIRTKPNALASLLNSGGQIMEKATDTLDRVNRVLSDRNIEAMSGAMQDLRATSAELASHREMFASAASALAKFDTTMSSVRRTAGNIDAMMAGDGRRALANAAEAAAELRATMTEARTVLAGVARTNGSVGGSLLPQITETMESLQDATQQLNVLVRSIRQDPRGTLLKGRTKERELK